VGHAEWFAGRDGRRLLDLVAYSVGAGWKGSTARTLR
jgi:hypothetical protein